MYIGGIKEHVLNREEVLVVKIKPTFNGHSFTKNTWLITSQNDSIQISKLRFYLTNFEFIDAQNNSIKIPESNYLIDAFDQETLQFDLKTIKKTNFKHILYKIGVDEKLHDAGAQSGALDPINGMYWAWQSGFINFKLEGKSPSCNTRKNKFTFHLGGYKMPYSTTRDVRLDLYNKEKYIIIKMDISSFFNDLSLTDINQVMIPGEEAYQCSLQLPQLFSITNE